MRGCLELSLVGWALALAGSTATAQETGALKPIPSDTAVAVAKRLTADLAEIAGELAGAPLAMAPDVDKAYGLYHPESGAGVIVVPVKGLEADGKGAEGREGTPVGYLFPMPARGVEASSVGLVAANGKPYRGKRLFITWIPPDGGERREVEVLRLRLKKDGEGPGQLLAYTMDKQPAVVVPLREQAANSRMPINLGVKGASKTRVTLVVSLHDKYAADVVFGGE
jgi:hypothetical protein